MNYRSLVGGHHTLKPRVLRTRKCELNFTCRWHVVHQDNSLSHCDSWTTAISSALNYEPPPFMWSDAVAERNRLVRDLRELGYPTSPDSRSDS